MILRQILSYWYHKYVYFHRVCLLILFVEMLRMSEKCYFGKLRKEDCNDLEQKDINEKEVKLVNELSENDQELVWWRSGLEKADDAVICLHLEIDC